MAFTPTFVQNSQRAGDACPDANLLAAYIDGRVAPQERAGIEAHLARCEECYFVFSETCKQPETESDEERLFRHQAPVAAVSDARSSDTWPRVGWKTAAALAAAAAVVVAVQVYRSNTRPPVEGLRVAAPGGAERGPAQLELALNELNAAAGPYRTFEGRLTDGLTYRALAAPVRSASSAGQPPLSAREAALKVERAAQGGTPEERRALAVMYLTLGNARRAAEAVTPIAKTATEPELLNDIAVAYLARGSDGDADYALTLLERAVTRDPNRPEPWFNLGLAAQSVGQLTRAQEAWTRYLALDSSSPWANEARGYLERVAAAERQQRTAQEPKRD